MISVKFLKMKLIVRVLKLIEVRVVAISHNLAQKGVTSHCESFRAFGLGRGLGLAENHERQGFHASKLKSGKEKHAKKESRGTLDHFVKESEPEIEVLRANKVPLCRISANR